MASYTRYTGGQDKGRALTVSSGANRKNVRAPSNRDWLADQARQYPVKTVVQFTGLSQRTVENVRAGDVGLSMDSIVNWCRADPAFRAQFFVHCGGHLECDPEFLAGLTLAISAYMRGRE